MLADGGYVAPHWPPPWGVGADAEHQLVIADELQAGGVEAVGSSIALGWAGPTIVVAGTDEQRARLLPGILDGSDEWCQLFSEPDAGSDLVSLRTTARRDGDEYVVNGQKIWSTWANRSRYGILLARTGPAGSRGISYFVLDMSAPGIEIRPIIEMTGGNHFNEVWLSDVRVPVSDRIGVENEGWPLAKATLGNERLSLSDGGVLWGMGPTSVEVFDALRAGGRIADRVDRQRAAALHTEMVVLRLLGAQIVASTLGGHDSTAQASIRKTLADVHGQHAMTLMKDRRGPAGMLGTQDRASEATDVWHWGYLFSRALTIGGGTSEVQRNIIGEQLLGLPREPR